jgi:hypothetical protein
MTTDTLPVDALARAQAGELLGPADIMAIFHLSQSAFYRRKARGDFDHLMVRGHTVGTHVFSGVLVHRYVSGEAVYEPTFGRKRGAR